MPSRGQLIAGKCLKNFLKLFGVGFFCEVWGFFSFGVGFCLFVVIAVVCFFWCFFFFVY